MTSNRVRTEAREPSRHVAAIAVRDFLEFVRDRRTVFITLLLPMLMYPIVAISSFIGVRTAVREAERQSSPAELAVVLTGDGADEFRRRIESLELAKIAAGPSAVALTEMEPLEAAERLETGKADFWVDVPAGFARSLAAPGTVKVEARVSGRMPAEQRLRDQFAAVLQAVSREAVLGRLAGAGLPATAVEPIRLSFRDPVGQLAAAGREAVPTVVSPILILLAVLTLTGAFYPAVDAIAGEKERGTIETLLVAPCTPFEIAAGKFSAIYVVTILTLVSNVVSISLTAWVASRFVPKQIALFPEWSAGGIAIAIVSFLALAAIGAALSLAVTAASRSTKEAQHSLTPVIIAVSLLSALALSPGIRAAGPVAAVPFTGQVLVAREAIAPADAEAGPLSAVLPLAVTVLAAAVVTVGLLWVTGRLLADEEVLFRGPDSVEGVLRRPSRRPLPTPVLAILPAVVGLAALWYLQAFVPEDLLVAIPAQQLAALALPLVALAWWQRVDPAETFRIAWPAGGPAAAAARLLGAALLGAGLFFVGAAAVSAWLGEDASAEAKELSARIATLVATRPKWLVWLVLAAVPAVCEEAVFRGWTLSGLLGRHPDRARRVVATIVQAGLFALLHLLPERMPTTFLLGVVLGWIALSTGSLLPGIVCHAVHNTMPIVLLSIDAERAERLVAPAWVPLLAGLVAVVGGCLVARGGVRPGSPRSPDRARL